jgi:hypothetical protein
MHRFPAVVEPLRDGRLCVTSLIELSKVLTEKNWEFVLPRFFGCSKKEAQRVAVQVAPLEAPPRRDVIAAVRLAPGAGLHSESVHPVGLASSPKPAPTPEARSVPAQVVPLTPVLHRIHFTASERFVRKLSQVKDALAHRFPEGNLESILEAGLDLLLAQGDKRRGQASHPRKAPPRPAPGIASAARHIPASVKREVFARDGPRCQWQLASGGTCGATRFLELDHRIPRARGGATQAANLRVLCRAHNQQAAREAFGEAWMSRFAGAG